LRRNLRIASNAAIAAAPEATRQFMNVLGGATPFTALFNRRTIARLTARAAA